VGEPVDISNALLWLSSDDARYAGVTLRSTSPPPEDDGLSPIT